MYCIKKNYIKKCIWRLAFFDCMQISLIFSILRIICIRSPISCNEAIFIETKNLCENLVERKNSGLTEEKNNGILCANA